MDDFGQGPYAAPQNDSLVQLQRMMGNNKPPPDQTSSVLNSASNLINSAQGKGQGQQGGQDGGGFGQVIGKLIASLFTG